MIDLLHVGDRGRLRAYRTGGNACLFGRNATAPHADRRRAWPDFGEKLTETIN
jgi:hypothetical protein